MFNKSANKCLIDEIDALRRELRDLQIECQKLRAASIMRVGPLAASTSFWGVDDRPEATALDLVKQLMECQKLEVVVEPAKSAAVVMQKVSG